MTKLTKLLILFIMLSTGVISCTVNSLVTDKDIINRQYNDFIAENGLPSREEMLPPGEVEVADLVGSVKTDAKQSATTKTRDRHAINGANDKKSVYKLPDVQKNTSPTGEVDSFRMHVNLGNAYRKEGKDERAVLEYEKALALKPEHSIAKKSLSELYYSLGSTRLDNKEYVSAIDAFNRVLKINPAFPQIRDALERAHYDLGVHYAINGEPNKAVQEFNKNMGSGSGHAVLDKNNRITIGTGKGENGVPGKVVHRGDTNYVESVSVSPNNDIRKNRTVLPGRTNNEVVAIRENTPVRKSDNRGVVSERGLADSVNTGKSGKSQVKGQPFFTVRQGSNKNKLISPDKMPSSVGQLQMAGGAKPGNVQIIDPQERWSNQKKRMAQSALPVVAIQDEKPMNKVGLAHFDLGIVFVDSGMVDDAIRELQSAVEINPNHLESHVSLGIAYRSKGMTNKALSEFKKAADINPGEAVANIACNSLSVAETSPKGEMEIVNGHVKLGNEYRKEGKGKRAVLEYEKVLALKPKHSIAKKSLSELYYSLGSTSLRNREYTSAINAFNRVLEINPGFPRIRDSLEKAHYDFGVHFAKNGELNKAIVEFNKTMKVGSSYAMLDKKQQTVPGTEKGEKVVHRGDTNYVESVSVSANNNIRKSSTVLPGRTNNDVVAIRANTPVRKSYNRGVVTEMGLAGKGSEKEARNSIAKSVQSHRISSNTWQSQGADSLQREESLRKSELSKVGRNQKQVPGSIAYKQTAVKQKVALRRLSDQSHMNTDTQLSTYREKTVDKNKTGSDYQVYSYKIITNNNKAEIGVNEAIKKYEDATIKSPYDNNAFNNLANAYYSKAMCVDEAIARKEGASEGSQNFSVKRYYLDDDTDSEKISNARSFGQTKRSEKYYNNFGYKLGNVYAKVSPEDIIKYKNALRDNPKSSDALYGLAFSFSVKGSSTGVALKSENNHKEMSFGY